MRYTNPERYLWHSAKNRAKKSNLLFNITAHDIKIPSVCPLLDIPLFITVGEGRTNNSPSLDRVDNSRGYERDNIWVISDLANMMKSSASKEQLIIFAYNILKKFK